MSYSVTSQYYTISTASWDFASDPTGFFRWTLLGEFRTPGTNILVSHYTPYSYILDKGLRVTKINEIPYDQNACPSDSFFGESSYNTQCLN